MMAPRMAFLRKIFWLALYLVATLVFVVLFEHGTENFSENFQKQLSQVQTFVTQKVKDAQGKS